MGDLTANLSRYEFECSCGCGANTVDIHLPQVPQMCLYHFSSFRQYRDWDMGIEITSGGRCDEHNRAEGGSETSYHKRFQGCDFFLYDKRVGKHKRVPADDVYDFLDRQFPTSKGIGRYDGRTHYDSRKTKTRWDKRRK